MSCMSGLQSSYLYTQQFCGLIMKNTIFFVDINTNLMMPSERWTRLRQIMDLVLSVVSTEPKNFTASVPTFIDIFADLITIFSQLSLPAMNFEHDLINGAYKVCDFA
jgi:hypothetical protein